MCIFSPFSIYGAIIISAEIYCELTLPGRVVSPPASRRPLMRNGGKPFSPIYCMSAPSPCSVSTNILMGRCFILSVPVSMVRLSVEA